MSGVYAFPEVDASLWHFFDIRSLGSDRQTTGPPHLSSQRSGQKAFLAQWREHFSRLELAPEERCSLWQRYFYTWLNPYIQLAAHEKLEVDKLPLPLRAHRTFMSGSRLSERFREEEVRDGRDVWRPFVETVICTDVASGTRTASGKAASSQLATPRHVAFNPLAEVYFRTEPHVRGRLRWVGYVTPSDTPRQLFAGVEWTQGLPSYREALLSEGSRLPTFTSWQFSLRKMLGVPMRWFMRSATPSKGGTSSVGEGSAGALDGVVHCGRVHGEDLFYQAQMDVPPCCTCERVEDIMVVAAVSRNISCPRTPSLLRVMLKAFQDDILSILLPSLAALLCRIAAPLLLEQYVKYLESTSESGTVASTGVMLIVFFFVVNMLQPLADNKDEQRQGRLGSLLSSSMLSLIVEKCLTKQSFALPGMSSGRVLTMAGSDMENIDGFATHGIFLFIAPLELICVIGLLYRLVGWCALSCVVVFVSALPIQVLISRWQARLQGALASCTDERLRTTNELFSGIRVVKTMAWERRFVSAIEKTRALELDYRRRLQISYCISGGVVGAVPLIMMAAVFVLYNLTGNVLEPHIVYPIIALLNAVAWPCYVFPMAVTSLVKFRVSMERLTKFLESDDKHTTLHDIEEFLSGREKANYEEPIPAVVLEKATLMATTAFRLPPSHPSAAEGRVSQWLRLLWRRRQKPVELDWVTSSCAGESEPSSPTVPGAINRYPCSMGEAGDEDDCTQTLEDNFRYILVSEPLLMDVSLRIPYGALTVVVGHTGSGKSALLSSILGMLDVAPGEGRAWVTRRVAYVPQQPWIMQDTIKANITFLEQEEMHTDRSGGPVPSNANSGIHVFREAMKDVPMVPLKPPMRSSCERVERAVQVCQLQHDIEQLPFGLLTAIGEKGVNLSGGQRARVSLARAVYADCPLYLLDDPLSALDVHVSKCIFEDVVLNELRGKTRVLATHQLHVLASADFIIVMEGGRVVFSGNREAFDRSSWKWSRDAPGDTGHDVVTVPSRTADDCLPVLSPTERAEEVDQRPFPHHKTECPSASSDGPFSRTHSFTAGGVSEGGVHSLIVPDPHCLEQTLIGTEEKDVGRVPWSVYCRCFQSGGGNGAVLLMVGMFVVSNLFYTSGSVWLSMWSTRRFPSLSERRYLSIYLFSVMGSILLQPLALAFAYRFSLRSGRFLHRDLLRTLATGTITFFDSTPVGRVMNRFAHDMYVLEDELPEQYILLIDIAGSTVMALLVTVFATPWTVFVIAVAAVAFYYFLSFYTTVIREVRRRTSIAQSPFFSMLGAILDGRDTIDAYGKSHVIFAESLHLLDRLYTCTYLLRVVNQWLSIRVQYIGSVIIIAIVCIGVVQKLLANNETMTSQQTQLISLSLTMTLNFFWTLPFLVRQTASVEAAMSSAQRVLHYVDLTDREELGLERCGDAFEKAADVVVEPDSPASMPCPLTANADGIADAKVSRGSLVFNHVDLRYRPHMPLVLRDVSFSIMPGERVGVVGRTGSGKSTLLMAFMRLIDACGGHIHVSGRHIRSYSLPALRQLFAMIPQDPVLFEGTIRSNLDPFGERNDGVLLEALRAVGLISGHEYENADVRLDAMVQSGGINFSVGQRQLLCIARVVVRRDVDFVLMDEATANVDPVLDQRIQKVISDVCARYTVVTIAHRLPTVIGYDRILVFQQGRLVEQGAPSTLLRHPRSYFYRMVAQGAASPDAEREWQGVCERTEDTAVREARRAAHIKDYIAQLLRQCK